MYELELGSSLFLGSICPTLDDKIKDRQTGYQFGRFHT